MYYNICETDLLDYRFLFTLMNLQHSKYFRNAEVMAKFNSQIDEQRRRREKAENANRRIRELLNEVTGILYKLCEKFQVRVINYKPIDDRIQIDFDSPRWACLKRPHRFTSKKT